MVGWPRRVARAADAVARRAACAEHAPRPLELEPWLTRDDFRRFKWIREAEREFQPFHQRTFFAAHPDLTFAQLNDDQPLTTSPYHQDGVLERMELIRDKMPGVDEIITRMPPHGRRASAHAAGHAACCGRPAAPPAGRCSRLPIDPTWDSTGMRMELVR